jgi:proton-translocating NADH-quinone oxidoreductase chain L
MLVNRIGDIALLIAMSIMFYHFGSVKYAIVFAVAPYFVDTEFYFILFNFKLLNVITFFLFLGAMGKSAQLGLHIWLPDAMEGPTPVSALIHAATMVTAGVFLVIRSSFLFEYADSTLVLVGLIGAFTCFFSSIIGAFQFDIKKIVAYSTCSQLGYMFFSCGVSNYTVSLFHLFNHAFFKALLFLSMGAIIHAMSDEQDFRRMGGLLNLLPFTYVMVMVGSLSLLAFPFLTGFYSKDMILEFTYARFTINSFFLFLLGVFAAFFTAFYSTRLIYWVFLSSPNFYKSNLPFIHEPGFFMTFSMFILFLFSVFAGYIFNEAFIGIGSSFFGNSIFVFIYNFTVLDAEFSLFYVKYIPLFINLAGILMFFFSILYFEKIYFFFFKHQVLVLLNKFFSRSFFFDLVLVVFFLFKFLIFSYLNIYKFV